MPEGGKDYRTGTERPQPGRSGDDGQVHPAQGSAGPDTGQAVIKQRPNNLSGGEQAMGVPPTRKDADLKP